MWTSHCISSRFARPKVGSKLYSIASLNWLIARSRLASSKREDQLRRGTLKGTSLLDSLNEQIFMQRFRLITNIIAEKINSNWIDCTGSVYCRLLEIEDDITETPIDTCEIYLQGGHEKF